MFLRSVLVFFVFSISSLQSTAFETHEEQHWNSHKWSSSKKSFIVMEHLLCHLMNHVNFNTKVTLLHDLLHNFIENWRHIWTASYNFLDIKWSMSPYPPHHRLGGIQFEFLVFAIGLGTISVFGFGWKLELTTSPTLNGKSISFIFDDILMRAAHS